MLSLYNLEIISITYLFVSHERKESLRRLQFCVEKFLVGQRKSGYTNRFNPRVWVETDPMGSCKWQE